MRTAKATAAALVAVPLALGGMAQQAQARAASPSPSGTFGPGCPAVSQKIDTVKDKVTEAAAAYPQLSQLVSAAVRARLNGTLDSKSHITVFAPSDQAFQKVTASQLTSLLKNQGQLKKVLTYHVVDKQITPDELSHGSFTTVEGSKLTTSGSGTDFKVNGKASIVCGNIKAANATIYVVDAVLQPPSS
ncbi:MULTISPECIES: fasciclin domain-containing protein [Streptomyces]|uniref:fasciclin domain-containing protein n=1 Tax=Streptomyces TaxID=1883 RepID=UPI001EE4CD79|nr:MULTISPECIES: fasciclin domain-containing protein [Streptomyces]WSI83193.1 fasciclin domain-containing protein [Streptomyces murinus]WUD04923.1 fasciclin domain-containing protein [Streptomyces murinus]